MTESKYIYDFSEGNADMKGLLGGKGANLAQMSKIGLPVPPGFTLTTEACLAYWERGAGLLDDLWAGVEEAVARLEKAADKTFGRGENPLLLSVRSGAPVSMPGMMDTILNLGLNDETVEALAANSGEPRFAYDSYRRFIQMFSDVVLGVSSTHFENEIVDAKRALSVRQDYEIDAATWKKLIKRFKEIVKRETRSDFPVDPWVQLRQAIEAVFKSWNTPRAKTYRRINKISDALGTAVNVMTMVFGNLGEDCGTGVCFTRNPSTGEKGLYGEFLVNAQGEDVVAGIRTPQPIAELGSTMPTLYRELLAIASMLERHYRDMQDIEFTIERNRLFILQTRNGKRTARSAVLVAVDMVEEGLIDRTTAVRRVTPDQVEKLLHKQVDPSVPVDVLATGLPASPGAAVGAIVFDPDEAERRGDSGEAVILVRHETTPDDIHGLFAAQGVLTSHGGMTSHAAVVARGLGKPCVSGCEALEIDADRGTLSCGGRTFAKGDILTIDGSRGLVIAGNVPLMEPAMTDEFRKLLTWADAEAAVRVWANADTPADAARARDFGARGIGLCRTEHMFMAPDRLPVMKEMIIASTKEERVTALDKLQVMQEEDYRGIFRAMEGLPVTVRLLDPPLHEFLPKEAEIEGALKKLRDEGRQKAPETLALERTLAKAKALKESNPMLGFRGCRLGIIYPEIYEMQIRAIFLSCLHLAAEGVEVVPHIMMPLVGVQEEMKRLKAMTDRIAEELFSEAGCSVAYETGTMIEVPRAALIADELAEYAQFFSFGTNDLTQTTFGYSRDDAENKFLAQYVAMRVLPEPPFRSVDRNGVGRLMRIAFEDGRRVRPDLGIGICGEHGGDPDSIAFCHKLGLNYVSCSPYRVPVARISAAHAALGLIE
ncbi:pyruvate, phosphate dikinase [Aminirod propionatiphilus]|uniref:Pyruvate, phosphate dikinase n=1 Tax=Aminirod propionatiphilus TaxID=3415223 RepID=A0ACD1DSH3_9BACT|nr:pyruvate, phosphate dikinase [Synergistota bacterium]